VAHREHALEIAHKALVDKIVDYTDEAITDVVMAGIAASATAVGGLAGAGAAAAAAPVLHAEIDKAVEHIAERIGFTPEKIKHVLHGAGHALVEHYRKVEACSSRQRADLRRRRAVIRSC
jgi:predicted transcriptional regulator